MWLFVLCSVYTVCCKTVRLEGKEPLPGGLVRKKIKEKKEERRILKLKDIFVDVMSKWPVFILTKGYICLFSTALLRNQL